ncbi:hypothetical protein AB1E18_001540 [Capra hircus]
MTRGLYSAVLVISVRLPGPLPPAQRGRGGLCAKEKGRRERQFPLPSTRGGAPRGRRGEGKDTDTASRPAGLLFSCHGFEIIPFLPIEFCTTCSPVLPNECHGLGQTVFGNAADEDAELMMEVTVVTSQKSPEPAPQSPHKQPFVTASQLASSTRGWPCPKPLSRKLLPEGSERAELCHRRPSVSTFRLEVREWDALSAAGLTPGNWVGPPAPRAGLGLSVDRGRAAREARVRLRPGRGCARSGASGRPRGGFKCIPGVGARGGGSELSLVQPPLRSPARRAAPGTPLLGPPRRAGRRPGTGTQPRAHGHGLSKSNVETPHGKEVGLLSTLLRVESGISRKLLENPARALAVNSRSGEEKQLPPKSCLPLPPKAPRRLEPSRKAQSHALTWVKPKRGKGSALPERECKQKEFLL